MTPLMFTHPLFAHCGKPLTCIKRKVELDLQPASYSTPNEDSSLLTTRGLLYEEDVPTCCPLVDETCSPIDALAALSSSS